MMPLVCRQDHLTRHRDCRLSWTVFAAIKHATVHHKSLLQSCSCHHIPVLKLHMNTGSQVQSPAGEWQPITLKQNQVAVFAGEMLQHATCGRIKAAVHRVVLDPAAYQTVMRHPICQRLQALP